MRRAWRAQLHGRDGAEGEVTYDARDLIVAGRITRERSCDGKRKYRTLEYAKSRVRLLKRKGIERHAYFCPFCLGYHLATDRAA